MKRFGIALTFCSTFLANWDWCRCMIFRISGIGQSAWFVELKRLPANSFFTSHRFKPKETVTSYLETTLWKSTRKLRRHKVRQLKTRKRKEILKSVGDSKGGLSTNVSCSLMYLPFPPTSNFLSLAPPLAKASSFSNTLLRFDQPCFLFELWRINHFSSRVDCSCGNDDLLQVLKSFLP